MDNIFDIISLNDFRIYLLIKTYSKKLQGVKNSDQGMPACF